MDLKIRGNYVNEAGKTVYYFAEGIEKGMLERKLIRMPKDEWVKYLRINGYTLVDKE